MVKYHYYLFKRVIIGNWHKAAKNLAPKLHIVTENCEKPVFNEIEEGCAQYIACYVANCYSNKNPH